MNTDPQSIEFDIIRNLNQKGDNNPDLIVEGIAAIRAALQNGFTIKSLFHDLELSELDFHLDNVQACIYTNRSTLSQVVGFPFHRHAIASMERPQTKNLQDTQGPYVFLNGVSSPENVGSIVRTCVGFGIKTIVFDYASCSPYVRRCVRVSMGNCFRLNVVKSESSISDLNFLKGSGYQIVSFELSDQSISLENATLSKNSVLVFGSEGQGVEQQILEISDQVIKIKMAAEVGSLNVSQSAAIALYHLSLTN